MRSDSEALRRGKLRSLVSVQWLSDKEDVRAYSPSTYGNYRSKIRWYPPLTWKLLMVLGWSAMKLFYPLAFFASGSASWRELTRFEGKPPPLIAFGSGRRCRAARVVKLGPRREGAWVLTEHRFGYAAVKAVDVKEPLPSGKTKKHRRQVPDVRIDVPASEFTFEGDVTRKAAGQEVTYLRICFNDGSGIDILSPRGSWYQRPGRYKDLSLDEVRNFFCHRRMRKN